jgi:DNA-directed RNA polymerase specialized sigma24 family protein
MLLHRHRLQPADVEDVVSEAVVEVLSAPAGYSSGDGLFVMIAQRRALDLLRKRSREVPLRERRLTIPPDRTHLDIELIERAIRRYAAKNPNTDAERLLGVTRRALQGSTFVEACRESGIPRGSQSRYRKTLEGFLDRFLRRH